MEIGKAEFAPDYKSEKSSDVTVGLTGVKAEASAGSVTPMCGFDPVALLTEPTSIARRAETIRLEREVIEAAKKWRNAQGEYTHVTEVDGLRPIVASSWRKLRGAVDALLTFESEHNIKQ